MSFKGDILPQDQEGDDAEGPTRRWSVQPRVQRDLSGTWLLYALAQLQQNRELNLQLRTMLSPGAGYNLFRTNAHQAIAFVGLAAQNEQYTDSTTASGERDVDSFAASLGGQYRAYRYDTPELDLTLGFRLSTDSRPPQRGHPGVRLHDHPLAVLEVLSGALLRRRHRSRRR
ncbi:MAG: DUF481 domain-containing protein [Gemmatimonadota bacterium]|nr:DUF481 domain-containing protein [Gemmatimonadota bacterium]